MSARLQFCAPRCRTPRAVPHSAPHRSVCSDIFQQLRSGAQHVPPNVQRLVELLYSKHTEALRALGLSGISSAAPLLTLPLPAAGLAAAPAPAAGAAAEAGPSGTRQGRRDSRQSAASVEKAFPALGVVPSLIWVSLFCSGSLSDSHSTLGFSCDNRPLPDELPSD